jgi:hypothetical protein
MIMPLIPNSAAPALEHPGDSSVQIDTASIREEVDTSRPRNDERARTNRTPSFKIASTRHEWEAALGLVYKVYVRSGLIRLNRHQMRITPHHALPSTELLLAVEGNKILGTLSIVGDGELGLPMETIYAEEVEQRRRQGLRLAEVSCLADGREESSQSFAMISRLMAMTAQCASHRGVDQLLIAVHPRHARFYERFLAFQVIGGQRTYASVCDHPAVAMAMDLESLSFDHPRAYRRLYGVPFDDDHLEYRPVSHALRSDLRLMAAETHVEKSVLSACA